LAIAIPATLVIAAGLAGIVAASGFGRASSQIAPLAAIQPDIGGPPHAAPMGGPDAETGLPGRSPGSALVLFRATDGAGAPLTDVTVSEDGKPMATRLDGRPVEVKPGTHDFLFTARLRGAEQQQEVLTIVKDDGQAKDVTVTFWRL
jgi:hypothetical protein